MWLIMEKWEAVVLSSHEWMAAANHLHGEHNETILLNKFKESREQFIPSRLLVLHKKVIYCISD